MKKSNPDRYRIKVLEKALRILELFGGKDREFTATEISETLGLNKASTFRILSNLEEADFVEKDGETAKYSLGIKVYYLGRCAEPHTKLKKIARPFLVALNRKCGETVHLAVLHQGEALYLDKIEGNRTIRVISQVGAKLPAHCSGVGKALLAALPGEQLEEVIRGKGLRRFTEKTITDLEKLRRELAKFRERGYTIDNEEIEEGLKCVAAPILGSNGETLAAISISAPSERFNGASPLFVSEVKDTAAKISAALRTHMEAGKVLP
ncbi:MAG: IclR family transcriptional regulator [Deltaproteobacteria bacterium]|nr:IclR family transcriptional regulator [Deltaproteobacteria bacterium]